MLLKQFLITTFRLYRQFFKTQFPLLVLSAIIVNIEGIMRALQFHNFRAPSTVSLSLIGVWEVLMFFSALLLTSACIIRLITRIHGVLESGSVPGLTHLETSEQRLVDGRAIAFSVTLTLVFLFSLLTVPLILLLLAICVFIYVRFIYLDPYNTFILESKLCIRAKELNKNLSWRKVYYSLLSIPVGLLAVIALLNTYYNVSILTYELVQIISCVIFLPWYLSVLFVFFHNTREEIRAKTKILKEKQKEDSPTTPPTLQ